MRRQAQSGVGWADAVMDDVPWSTVSSWGCNLCGECCRPYLVALAPDEWMRIVQRYGYGVIRPRIDGFFLEKSNGRCVFQYGGDRHWLCAIQDMKPRACKVWPFKIYEKPKHDDSQEALFSWGGYDFYIYVDTLCPGLTMGDPSERLVKKVLPEVITLKLGYGIEQHYSTTKHGNST